MRLSEYGDTKQVSESSSHQPQVYRCPFVGVVCWYQKSKGRSPSEKASFVGPKFTRKGFGWLTENDTLKTKMEKSNHCSFGKLKSILKAPPIFLVALTPPYFLGGCFFCRCCWRSQSSKFGEHLPKKKDKLRDKPQQHVFPKLFKGSETLAVLG